MAEIQDKKFSELGLQKAVTSAKIVAYHRSLDDASHTNPILVLLHGYPQSSYIWRHLVPLLDPNTPLFIPDLPGYGQSAPTTPHDKVSIGVRILEALGEISAANTKAPLTPQPIVIIGHDRGARIAHALHVSAPHSPIHNFQILGLALLDIIPLTSQWATGSSATAQTGFFHWSFLANVHIAKPMIIAYGGGRWALDLIDRWSGTSVQGLERLRSGDALDVYRAFFDQESVIEASCRDYEAGATVDVDDELKANEEGRCIAVPLLLVYSEAFLGKKGSRKVGEVWGPWSAAEEQVTEVAVGEGLGHFVAEEAPENTAEALGKWLRGLGARK